MSRLCDYEIPYKPWHCEDYKLYIPDIVIEKCNFKKETVIITFIYLSVFI